MPATTANSVLIPFNTIIDIDIGLLRVIKEEFNNDKYLYTSLLTADTNGLRQLLYEREEPNPLNFLLKDEWLSSSDSLYSDFMDKSLDKIIKKSSPNAIKSLVDTFFISKLVDIDILCSNNYEKDHISKIYHKQNLSIIVESDYSNIDISKYDTIFIKVYQDILKFTNLLGKNIYLLDYKFNINLDHNKNIRPRIDIESLICQANQTILISPYVFGDNIIAG